MERICDRLRVIINSFEGGNKSKFGVKIGTQSGLVGDWLREKSNPGPDYRVKICTAYGINRAWLDLGEGEMLDPKIAPLSQVAAKLPLKPTAYENATATEITSIMLSTVKAVHGILKIITTISKVNILRMILIIMGETV